METHVRGEEIDRTADMGLLKVQRGPRDGRVGEYGRDLRGQLFQPDGSHLAGRPEVREVLLT